MEEILQRITRVETKLDQLISVTIPHILKIHDEQVKNLHGRVSKIEQSYTWIVRTLIGTIFSGVVGVTIAFFAK
jgi:hypothetical protein